MFLIFFIIVICVFIPLVFIIYSKFYANEDYSKYDYNYIPGCNVKIYKKAPSTQSDSEKNEKSSPFKELLKGKSQEELINLVNEIKEKAAAGDLMSINILIYMYLEGVENVIEADEAEAMRYMRLGADKGDAMLAYSYATRLVKEEDDVTKPDFIKYMKIAADGGHDEAQVYMYYILSEKEDSGKKAAFYLGEACKAGNEEAINIIREALKIKGMTEEEIEKTLSQFHKQQKKELKSSWKPDLTNEQIEDFVNELKEKASRGEIQAMIWLGDIYIEGQEGIPKDENQALKYWKMAADLGNTDMAFQAGLLIGRIKEDYATAFKYIKIGADAGNKDAMYTFYKFLSNGWGCNANPYEAYQYLRKAAEAGQADALQEIRKFQ